MSNQHIPQQVPPPYPPQQDKDVDLIALFALIGNGIKNVFRAIGRFLTWLGHAILVGLIYLKKYAWLWIGLGVLGFILGFAQSKVGTPIYEGYMQVKANHGSSYQLFTRMTYLNSLVGMDIERLGSELDMDTSLVSSISRIEIFAADTEIEILDEFNEAVKGYDTLTKRSVNFADFKASKMSAAYSRYSISVLATRPDIFDKVFQNLLVMEEAPAVEQRRLATMLQLQTREQGLVKRLEELDRLQEKFEDVYDRQELPASSPQILVSPTTGTQTFTGLDLVNRKNTLDKELAGVREQIKLNENTLVQISQSGRQGSQVIDDNKLKFAAAGMALGLLIIIGIAFLRFLNRYEKRNAIG